MRAYQWSACAQLQRDLTCSIDQSTARLIVTQIICCLHKFLFRRFYNKSARSVALGRRRVSETRLIKQITQKKQIFFLCVKRTARCFDLLNKYCSLRDSIKTCVYLIDKTSASWQDDKAPCAVCKSETRLSPMKETIICSEHRRLTSSRKSSNIIERSKTLWLLPVRGKYH